MNAAADTMHVQQITLDNGLKVYLSENHERPRIAARVVVRAGAAEDPDDHTGIAHYLEHMLANKGSQRLGTTDYTAEAVHLDRIRALYDDLGRTDDPDQARKIYAQIDAEGMLASRYAVPNELKQIYGLLGGRKLNAFTSHDQTAYVVEIPSNRLAQWASLEGDRFRSPVFRAFQTEVETVFEEKNRSLDDPGRRTGAALRTALWGDHPYSREILGDREHLRRPSISRMEAFFHSWYVPNNMAVVLAGDFDSEEAIALIEASFGGLVARPLPPRRRPTLQPLPAENIRSSILAPGVEEIRFAWRSVPFGHPDRPAGALADMLLDNRATGLLDRNLIIPQRVRAAGAFPRFMRGGGAQVLWGRPLDGQSLSEVEGLLLEQVDLLRSGTIEQDDLDAILLDYEQTYQKSLEENASRASLLMRAFLHEQPWRGPFSELETMRAVTPAQITDFAQTWMSGGRAIALRISGEPERLPPLAPPITSRSVHSDGHSDFFHEVLALPAAPIPPQPLSEGRDYHRRAPNPSLVLYSAPNPFNDLCQLTLRAPRGRAGDPEWAVAASLWQRAGAGNLDHTALSAELYRAGVSISLSTGQRISAMKIHAPDSALPHALSLLQSRVCDPRLPEDEARRLLTDAISQRRQHCEERRVLERALQVWLLDGDESNYLGGALSDEALASVDVSAGLKRLGSLWSQPWEALYSGPRGPASVLPLLERSSPIQPTPDLPSQRYVPRTEGGVWLVDHPSVQATVSILCPWGRYTTDEAHLHHLYGEYMGGSAGLVFQEIREARGMAYSAHAGWRLGWQVGDDNLLWASAGTQADKAAEVATLLVGMLRSLPMDPARFDRARASAIAQLRTSRFGFREIPGTVLGWDRRGHAGDPRPERLSKLSTLSPAALSDFAGAFADAPFQIAIVGDLKRIDQAALSALAPVHHLPASALFAY
ncbi:MAG: putative Zn-dependent peptidase [Myxococcota bacterium]|jgi:predicted Zn-dependent peptidase